jgi:hypothetical protein
LLVHKDFPLSLKEFQDEGVISCRLRLLFLPLQKEGRSIASNTTALSWNVMQF